MSSEVPRPLAREGFLAEAMGSSFDDSSVDDLSIADETEESLRLLQAIDEKAVSSIARDTAEEDDISVYEFCEDDLPVSNPEVKMKDKAEVVKKCCDSM